MDVDVDEDEDEDVDVDDEGSTRSERLWMGERHTGHAAGHSDTWPSMSVMHREQNRWPQCASSGW